MIIALGSAALVNILNVTLIGILNATVAKLTATEVRRGWERLPHALLCLAARRLRADLREDRLAEWAGELHELLSHPHTRPVTRLVHSIHYALGLLRVAPSIARAGTRPDQVTRSPEGSLLPASLRGCWHREERVPDRFMFNLVQLPPWFGGAYALPSPCRARRHP